MNEKERKIEEIQILEQNLQNLLYQKQAFQIELSETENALGEIKNSKDEIFKIIGQVMIKKEKIKIVEELSNKEKILNLRIKTIEKQENSIIEKLESLRKEFFENK